jgi:hypothetical protein
LLLSCADEPTPQPTVEVMVEDAGGGVTDLVVADGAIAWKWQELSHLQRAGDADVREIGVSRSNLALKDGTVYLVTDSGLGRYVDGVLEPAWVMPPGPSGDYGTLGVDDAFLYWARSDGLFRIGLGGGQLVNTGGAVDAGNMQTSRGAFWDDLGGVRKADLERFGEAVLEDSFGPVTQPFPDYPQSLEGTDETGAYYSGGRRFPLLRLDEDGSATSIHGDPTCTFLAH